MIRSSYFLKSQTCSKKVMADKNPKEKILIISDTPTHPSTAGNRTCILSYSELLKKMGYDVKFLWVVPYNLRDNEKSAMFSYWGINLFLFKINLPARVILELYKQLRYNLTGYYKIDDLFPLGLKKYIKNNESLHHFDAVIVNYVYYSKAFEFFPNSRKILFTHDVFTNKYQLTGSSWFSVTAKEETKALNRADSILAIQDHEADFFRSLTSKQVISCYSYFPITNLPFVGNRTLLYLAGTNEYNIESIEWFIENVLDELIKVSPEVILTIGGKICNVLQPKYKHPSITYFGEVQDLKDFYALGDVAINPTYNGTGLKIKTFEAMSYGKVLISHPHGKIGIYKESSAPILSAENTADYITVLNHLFDKKNTDLAKLQHDSIKYIQDLNDVVQKAFEKSLNK